MRISRRPCPGLIRWTVSRACAELGAPHNDSSRQSERSTRDQAQRLACTRVGSSSGKAICGFTVKNLAITYMPRGPGLSHADTLQQRGRFFGYKADYLDICRGWFNADTHSGFADYVPTSAPFSSRGN